MDEHNKHENDLGELHHEFDVFSHVHSFDDTAETGDSDKLQQTKQWQNGNSLSGNRIRDIIKRYRRHKINYEPSLEICPKDNLLVKHLVTTQWIVEGCLELDIYINTKNQINNRVEDHKFSGLHSDRLETDFQRDTEAVVNSKNDDENLEVNLFWMVDFKNTSFVDHDDLSVFLQVFIEIICTILNQELMTFLLLQTTHLVK